MFAAFMAVVMAACTGASDWAEAIAPGQMADHRIMAFMAINLIGLAAVSLCVYGTTA